MGSLPDSVHGAFDIMISIGCIVILGISAFGGYETGRINGYLEALDSMKTQSNCLQYEERPFAAVGFFGGNGEVRMRKICTHWEYRR